ncbi:hypothetical protein MFUL124B02_13220 [Myxococcus fulvus 124B02]|nr:hypothetical protein MFUL124B02_13220 [Myxococcus fulvus 124B02]
MSDKLQRPTASAERSCHASRDVVDLYRRYSGVAYQRALRLLRNADEARDVTQDAFVVLVARWERLAPRGATASLLFEISTGLAIDRLRRRKRREQPHEPMPEDRAAPLHWEPVARGGHERVEAARDLTLLTRGESPRTLAIATLHYVEGHSLNEVAATLSLSARTVRRLLARFVSRARKRDLRLG